MSKNELPEKVEYSAAFKKSTEAHNAYGVLCNDPKATQAERDAAGAIFDETTAAEMVTLHRLVAAEERAAEDERRRLNPTGKTRFPAKPWKWTGPPFLED